MHWIRALALAVVGVLVIATPASAASWTVVTTPNQGQSNNWLWGAEAISTTNAWAVGWSVATTAPYERPLTMRWNGSSWSIVSSPVPPAGGRLLDVDGAAANDVWAVGSHIVRWNGSAWIVVPQPGTTSLTGVKALSATSAWAVGSAGTQTAILRWDGSSWTSVPAPSPGAIMNRPASVDGTATDLWAVGNFCESPDGYGGCVHEALILRWDGSAWSLVPAPDRFANITGVTVVAANDVWAVGSIFDLSILRTVPYAIHWNGSAWARVAVPSPSADGGQLNAVTALSATKVYAVGRGSSSRPYITRWNGTTWATESTPSVTSPDLLATAAITPSTVWAVGTKAVSSTTRTLSVRTTTG